MREDVPIPPTYSFTDLVSYKNKDDQLHLLKVMTVFLKPGDCLYIPAYWWHQIQTITPNKPKKATATEEEKLDFKKNVQQLSVSVDFWYHVHSYWLRHVFYGIENGILK
mmetsp:Transcript_4800/g.8230  ORF Transcript_4800/g.8230 Transcript_4800/m.8230 type:complete len:109 (-) Transcript_4800:70-396(-)